MSHTAPDADLLEGRILRGDVAGAVQEAERILQELAGSDLAHEMACCHAVIAFGRQAQGRSSEALLAAYLAIETFSRLGDVSRLAVTVGRAAIDAARLADAQEASRLLAWAQELIAGVSDPSLSFCVLNNTAIAYQELGYWDHGVEAIAGAMLSAEQLADPYERAHARNNSISYRMDYAAVLLREGHQPAGHDLLEEALRESADFEVYCREHGYEFFFADLFAAAARALIADGRPQEARPRATHGEELTRAMEYQLDNARFHVLLAQIERATGDPGASVRHLELVQDVAMGCRDDNLLATYHFEKSLLAETAGDMAQALHHHKAFHALTVRLLASQNDARAQVMTIRTGNERARTQAQLMRMRAKELEGDVQELRSERELLSREVELDPLTGVGNRRRFDRFMLGLTQADHASVLMIDLDHFKSINDRFSHTTGDQVLVRVAAVLQQAARAEDIVCRFGGEEFVIACRGIALEDAVHLGQRIRRTLELHDWSGLHPELTVTASIGVAEHRGQAMETLDRADLALYEAKHAGRNCVRPIVQPVRR